MLAKDESQDNLNEYKGRHKIEGLLYLRQGRDGNEETVREKTKIIKSVSGHLDGIIK